MPHPGRELAARMTPPAESVAIAADLVESFARLRVLADRRRPALIFYFSSAVT